MAAQINTNATSKFNINRSTVLDGAIRGFKRSSYNPCHRISVKFSDDSGNMEEAIDLGGPRREFLRLLMQALKESSMFEGAERMNLALDPQGKCITEVIVRHIRIYFPNCIMYCHIQLCFYAEMFFFFKPSVLNTNLMYTFGFCLFLI